MELAVLNTAVNEATMPKVSVYTVLSGVGKPKTAEPGTCSSLSRQFVAGMVNFMVLSRIDSGSVGNYQSEQMPLP